MRYPQIIADCLQHLGKVFTIVDNVTIKERAVLCAGEIIGTAILMFVGCMGGVAKMSDEDIPALQSSLTFGFAVLTAIQIVGHISNAHINPAVTIGAVLLGNFPLINLPLYILSQMAGAIIGFSLLMLATPAEFIESTVININGTMDKSPGICSPSLNPNITILQAFVVEFGATSIIVMLCAAVWDHRNSNKSDSVAIKFAFTVAALSMAAGPYTGCHMNPARSFAPALLNGDWEDHWLFWVAPILGGSVGALFYRIVFSQQPKLDKDISPAL